MKRIDTATRAVDLFGPGKHGFKNGNALTGDLATKLDASNFNHFQEEIARVIEATGAALNPNSYTQLLEAINAIVAAAVAGVGGVSTPVYGPYISTNVDFNVLDAHATRCIEFTVANKVCNLISVGGRSGFPLDIINNAAAGDVTLDPSGSQTIDGQASRTLRPFDRARLISTGAEWRSAAGSIYSYTTPLQNFALATGYVFPHGLGRKPDELELWLENISAEWDWVPGDRLRLSGSDFGVQYGAALASDITNVYVATQKLYKPQIAAKAGGDADPGNGYINLAKWKWFARAVCRY